MNGRRALIGSFAALVIAGLTASSCGFRQPGRFLIPYPEADEAEYAKIHPTVSVYDARPKLALEAYSQRVADEILRTEQGRVQCNTAEARYFQIKAVYELRQNDLASADRDLKRAEDALRVSCVPPSPAEVGAPRAERYHRARHVRHHRKKKHCICK